MCSINTLKRTVHSFPKAPFFIFFEIRGIIWQLTREFRTSFKTAIGNKGVKKKTITLIQVSHCQNVCLLSSALCFKSICTSNPRATKKFTNLETLTKLITHYKDYKQQITYANLKKVLSPIRNPPKAVNYQKKKKDNLVYSSFLNKCKTLFVI